MAGEHGNPTNSVTKRRVNEVISSTGGTEIVHFETDADIVLIEDTAGKFTSNNVEGALQELAAGMSGAGKVDDVVNADGSSIVDENKKAQLKNAIVKEAGKVSKVLRLAGTLQAGGETSVPYDGSKDTQLTMDGNDFVTGGSSSSSTQSVSYSLKKTGVTPGTYQGIQVDDKGRVIAAEDKEYATKNELREGLAGKATTKTYDNYQAFVTAMGLLPKSELKVGDNIYIKQLDVPDMWVTAVNATSTTYTYTNDQAIINALDTTAGFNVGYFVFSKLETEKVDLSEYQKKADNDLQTTDKTVVGGINEVRSTANANATEISNIKDGTTEVGRAANVTTNINGKAISSIFETDGTTVKEATHASSANLASKVANKFLITTHDEANKNVVSHNVYDGSEKKVLAFDKDDFYGAPVSDNTYDNSEYTGVNMSLCPTGVTAGQYSAVNVDAKGRVTAGGKSIEWGAAGQTEPSDDLMVGGLFMELISQ